MLISSGSQVITFAATSGIQQFFSSGITVGRAITVDGVGGTLQLGDDITTGTGSAVTLTNGTLSLNGKVLSCGNFNSTNSNTRVLDFGTSYINIIGISTTLWDTTTVTGLTITGTPVVNLTNNSSGTTRTISPGSGISEANAFSFNVTAGSDTITISTSHRLKDLNLTGFSGTLNSTVRTIYGNLTLSPTTTCSTSGSATTFAATSGILTFAGIQSLMIFKPSDESRVGAPARNFNHNAIMPTMSMNADAEAIAVATRICRRGACAGAAGNAMVMPMPPVKLFRHFALHQEAVRQSQQR
jgi:hypothetical protein